MPVSASNNNGTSGGWSLAVGLAVLFGMIVAAWAALMVMLILLVVRS